MLFAQLFLMLYAHLVYVRLMHLTHTNRQIDIFFKFVWKHITNYNLGRVFPSNLFLNVESTIIGQHCIFLIKKNKTKLFQQTIIIEITLYI